MWNWLACSKTYQIPATFPKAVSTALLTLYIAATLTRPSSAPLAAARMEELCEEDGQLLRTTRCRPVQGLPRRIGEQSREKQYGHNSGVCCCCSTGRHT